MWVDCKDCIYFQEGDCEEAETRDGCYFGEIVEDNQNEVLKPLRWSMMKLKDILPNHYINIQARTYDPYGEDMLFGYCHWTGTKLVSDDGDHYSIEEEVVKYEFDEYGLAYWFESEWI